MTLILLPNLLAPASLHQRGEGKAHHLFLPPALDQVMSQIDGLIAESEGEGRRYLKRFATKKKPHEMPIALLSHQSNASDIDFLLEPVVKGEKWGVLSDAGLPCLADPGSQLVIRARQLNLPIDALSGPSSITLSLILSGLPGQNFFFHGYIPKRPDERENALREWEKMREVTHSFIETPYRNQHTLHSCLKVLKGDTLFSIAANLTMDDEYVHTAPIREWKEDLEFFLEKKPAIFLFRPR